MPQSELTIGFLTYGQTTAKYLPFFLPSLQQQAGVAFNIVALDNSEKSDNDNARYIKKNFPDIDFQWAGSNLGFAAAYNILLRRAVAAGAKYFLIINPDIVLEPDCLAKLVEVLERNQYLGAVAPKVLRWDFVNNRPTKQIDTCGIVAEPGLRFVDLGQAVLDRGQFDCHQILGPSGCCGLYRLAALEDIKVKDQYFDENFFMYKEDVDLAYRLKLAGWRCSLLPQALVYHDRSVAAQGNSKFQIIKNRASKSSQSHRWSFIGQQIIFWKYYALQDWFGKLMTRWYQAQIWLFVLWQEREMWQVYQDLSKQKDDIMKQAKLIKLKR